MNDTAPSAPGARLALVGDRSEAVRSHARIPVLLETLRIRDGLDLDAYWIPTEDAEEDLTGFDAIWVLPGSPYRSEAGVLAAIRSARANGIPFLGTCGGFPHALLEFARNVCGLARAGHAENTPGPADEDALVIPLACSLVGHEGTVHVTAGSRAAQLLGADRTQARYHCNYAPTPATWTCCADTAWPSPAPTTPARSASPNCPTTPSSSPPSSNPNSTATAPAPTH